VIPTSFVTDSGTAIPAANVINILGSSEISTSGAGNTVTIDFTGMSDGTGQTIGAVTADLITINAGAVPNCYKVSADVVGFEATTPAAIAYELINGVRTTGAAATLTNITDQTAFEEAALGGCVGDIVVSGNTFIVRVTGVAGQLAGGGDVYVTVTPFVINPGTAVDQLTEIAFVP
jgi:hypothetical protein